MNKVINTRRLLESGLPKIRIGRKKWLNPPWNSFFSWPICFDRIVAVRTPAVLVLGIHPKEWGVRLPLTVMTIFRLKYSYHSDDLRGEWRELMTGDKLVKHESRWNYLLEKKEKNHDDLRTFDDSSPHPEGMMVIRSSANDKKPDLHDFKVAVIEKERENRHRRHPNGCNIIRECMRRERIWRL